MMSYRGMKIGKPAHFADKSINEYCAVEASFVVQCLLSDVCMN